MKRKKADGAILTLTGYYNYGNILQRYALQKFLCQKGYNFVSYMDPFLSVKDVYCISFAVKMKTPLRMVKRFFKYQKPYWYIPTYGDLYPESYKNENIINFVNENIWIKKFDKNDNFVSYVVGSDQVWRDWHNNEETLGYYFLNFLGSRKVNRISYAASFGKDKIEEVMRPQDVEYVKPLIEKFDKISIREQSGVDIIKNTWGINGAKRVVDPTLLLNSQVYSDLIENSSVKFTKIQPIFSYILGEDDELKDFIKKIQDYRKQPVSKIYAHNNAEHDKMPHVEHWLKGFRDAELVITNSFHGMMFSVINNTDFIIIGKEEGGLSRIEDFLERYNIKGRFIDETNLANFDIGSLKPIKWNKVNKMLDEDRKTSERWLIDAIEDM